MTATTTLHVSNLPFTVTEEELRALFAPHGAVQSVNLVTDRDTGRPSGFGFVSLEESAAQQALAALENCVGDSLLGGRQRQAAIPALKSALVR